MSAGIPADKVVDELRTGHEEEIGNLRRIISELREKLGETARRADDAACRSYERVKHAEKVLAILRVVLDVCDD